MNELDRFYVYISVTKKAEDIFLCDTRKSAYIPFCVDDNKLVFFPTVCSPDKLEQKIFDVISNWEMMRSDAFPANCESKLIVHHIYLYQKGIALPCQTVAKIAEAGLSLVYEYTHLSL